MNPSENWANALAVVGLAGRFPGAANVDKFWANLCAGVEAIQFFSVAELAAEGVDPALLQRSDYVRAAATLDGIELFDAAFFGFTPREAEVMDPQQRLFLECAWQALESAGYDAERYDGAIGVYAGVGLNTYWLNLLLNPRIAGALSRFQLGLVNDKDHLPTRVSYKLNLRGPSVNVQTACSTSLVAVHLACQSLLNGECDIALAGGVSIALPQKSGYLYEEGGINSPDGHCRTFDAQAAGTVGGSGVGVVVLKRFAEAQAAGDVIHAVVLGSAINNDGAQKVGYTAPSINGQAQAIAEALAVARVAPETLSYIEAHGTATPLGDPIELAALTQVFRAQTDRQGFCALGSVKTNIGHLDAAAGVAGFIKTVLALKHRQLPPSLHFTEPNPKLNLESSPFYVNAGLQPWPSVPGQPRRAGVSSFGIGGTNAHVVLEEAPPVESAAEPVDAASTRAWQLLPLAAKTAPALQQMARNLAAQLRQQPDLQLADVAYTLQVGRRAFAQRHALVCRDLAEAATALEAFAAAESASQPKPQTSLAAGPLAFLFPGQGAQHVGMAADLYATEPVFRAQLDECAELLRPQLGLDLRSLLYPASNAATAERLQTERRRLGETWLTQPALFAVEYALAQLWLAWGVRPRALLGHSIGEYVAACLAGVFSLPEALALVAARGRLMQQAAPGAMLAVALSEAETTRWLNAELALAAVNGPTNCVVAGPLAAVTALEATLTAQQVACRRLETSHAFHSPMMEPVVGAFAEQVRRVTLRAPTLPLLSNVTGTWLTAEAATDPNYWAQQLRQPVRFGDGLSVLLNEPACVLLEVGPGQTLTTLAQRRKQGAQRALATLPPAKVASPAWPQVLQTLGQLWVAGVPVNWTAFSAEQRRQRVTLPTYPFERQRFWISAAKPAAVPASAPLPAQVTMAANPANPANEANPASATNEVNEDAAVTRVLAQQLQLMTQQLALLQQA